VTIGSSTRALRSSSADALTADGLATGLLTYSRALTFSPLPALALWAEGGFSWGSVKGTMFQTMSTDVANTGYTIGGRARYVPYRLVALSGRVDLGTARTSLSITDGSGRRASDSGWSTIAVAATAVDLLALNRPEFGFGLRFELGYVAARGVELSPKLAGSGGDLKLPTMQASIGHLDLSGPYFSIALMSQF
jgi:hypothetical protein